MARIDNSYYIPGLAGYSIDGSTVYIDKRLPRFITLPNGQKIDSFKYLAVHEIMEKTLEDQMLYKYPYAHMLATGSERHAVMQDGVCWEEYQKMMLKAVRDFKEISSPVPKDLDLKPQRDTHDTRMLALIKRYTEK